MRKLFLVICVVGMLILPLCPSRGEARSAATLPDITKLFNEGNSYYSRGKFNEAVKFYEEIISLGYESGPLYYNLGNAYFKSGALGKAILDYRRAERLEPLDADLKSNLEYVLSLVKQKSEAAENNALARLFLSLSASFSMDSIGIIYIALFILLFLWAAGFILISSSGIPERVEGSAAERVKNIRRKLVYIGIPVIICFIIAAAVLGSKYYDMAAHKEAVIIARNTNCKFEPFDDATTYFTLYEGENVIVASDKGTWAKIKRSDGKQGWIKKDAMELL